MTQHISYPTVGTCSRQIDIELEEGVIRSVTFTGGCSGNTQGIAALVRGIDENISIHDFRMVTGPTHTNVIFDAVVPFKFRLSDHEVEQEIQAAVKRLDSSYFAVVQIDRDYTK